MDRELKERENVLVELRTITEKLQKKEESWKIEIQTTKQKVSLLKRDKTRRIKVSLFSCPKLRAN